jgi:hypothetical protein
MNRTRISLSLIVFSIASLYGVSSPARPEADTAYFLVANPDLLLDGLSDSYVLPLSDPDDIAAARALLDGGFLIVSATVTVGSDGINRDMLASESPAWSWHVTRFHGFSEVTMELCDGNPTFTEAEAQNSSEGDEMLICYWSYTVVLEVTDLVPVEQSTWGSIKALYEN